MDKVNQYSFLPPMIHILMTNIDGVKIFGKTKLIVKKISIG